MFRNTKNIMQLRTIYDCSCYLLQHYLHGKTFLNLLSLSVRTYNNEHDMHHHNIRINIQNSE